jgi:hypothetical protein
VEGWQLSFQSAEYKRTPVPGTEGNQAPKSQLPWPRKNQKRTRNSHGTIAEFGPALVLFFGLLLIPSLTLIRFGLSTTAIYFILGRAADSAAQAPTYDQAKQKANGVFLALINSPIGSLSGLKVDRIKNVNLYIDERILTSGEVNVFGPDQLVSKQIYPAINTYEYEVRASYSFPPLLPASDLPLVGKVPLLGEETIVTLKAVRPIEYPDGLSIFGFASSTP